MKSILITIALMPAALFAELSIPSSVFTMKELSEAQAKANSKKEPLIFVYTDPGTT